MRALAAPLTRVLAPPTRAYSRGPRSRARIAAMNTTKTPPHDGDVEPWYPIGTPGVPWTEAQREQWRASGEDAGSESRRGAAGGRMAFSLSAYSW